ncbi:cysteine desulfurase family protein [Bythopirellula polymerisocia]|uniref:cysteine desulfurase n=1 Tax=Bythopirellula polymerisocia TaxID=2528003 RepID=A0A5C6CQD0_9BACT|nr:cysteine desulfurase family protein [Bythopirellula polymerisocia]TWU25621.1 Cysteine desulfurase [Bythopirellula polymerisocia]
MTKHPPIYMDNHATTRTDPRVVEAMLPYFSETYGNPGSVGHSFGEEAHEAVEIATGSIAECLHADPREIIFTSGATESNNLAIRGVAERNQRRGKHLVSVRTEHRAVLEPLERLGQSGYTVTLLDVEQHGSSQAGWLDPERVAEALQDDTILVSVMLANNEIGVIQSLAEIAAVCRHSGVLLHCDATQAVGKIPVDVRELGVDLMSFSGHKIYGPKGIGALYVRQGSPIVRYSPQITGGGQQGGRRSGTLNVPGIVGMAKALQLCVEEMPTEMERLADLRDRLLTNLQDRVTCVSLCGPATGERSAAGGRLRLPGNLDVAFGDIDGEALIMEIGNLAVSSGATCSSHEPGPSHVLLALGLGEDLARSSLRFGLGRFNTSAEVDLAVESVSHAVEKLRKLGAR